MRSRWLGCLLVLAACGDSAEEPGGFNPYADSGVAPIVGATGGTTGGTLAPGGTTAGTVPATIGGTTAGTVPGGTTGGTAPTAENLPCDVQKILKEKCQTCHSAPPVGAPVPLVTWANLQVDSGSKPGTKMYTRLKEMLNDKAKPMPPVNYPQLTAAEKATLEAFSTGGGKAAAQNCGTTVPPTTGGTGGAGGGTGGGSANCDVTMDLVAHGGQTENDKTPYTASGNGDAYEIFWYKPTWNDKMHAIGVDPIVDNGAILHHWLLYMKETGSEAPGSHNPDSGLQSAESMLLSGWAPGNDGFKHPDDVGLYAVYGAKARFGIEIHYNTNANPKVRTDRSGARLCMTKTLRAKEAATHWLGTQVILPISPQAVGTCTVPKESHIIAHSPHMHKMGKYMKTIIQPKGGGAPVTITDQPFAFTDQQIFPIKTPTGEIVVKPGDVITTTCDYTGLNTFGPGTDSEMCYNFVVAWPAGSLSLGAGIVGGKNTCIDFL